MVFSDWVILEFRIIRNFGLKLGILDFSFCCLKG